MVNRPKHGISHKNLENVHKKNILKHKNLHKRKCKTLHTRKKKKFLVQKNIIKQITNELTLTKNLKEKALNFIILKR